MSTHLREVGRDHTDVLWGLSCPQQGLHHPRHSVCFRLVGLAAALGGGLRGNVCVCVYVCVCARARARALVELMCLESFWGCVTVQLAAKI